MVAAGDQVIIDQGHKLFGGKPGIVQWVERRRNKSEYLVTIEGTGTTYEFSSEELLVP